MLPNTCPFDVSGHPAMSVPCGMSAGAAGRHAAGRRALRRVDDLPRRARVRAARRLAQLLARRSARTDWPRTRSAPTGCAAARDDRLRPQGTLSYVSGATDEPLRFHHRSRSCSTRRVGAPRRARRGDLRRRRALRAVVVRPEAARPTRWRRACSRSACGAATASASGRRTGVEWLLAQFGTARIGAVLVNINPAYRATELEYALNKVGCRALVMARSLEEQRLPRRCSSELAPEIHRPRRERRCSTARRLPAAQARACLIGDGRRCRRHAALRTDACSRSPARRIARGSTR